MADIYSEARKYEGRCQRAARARDEQIAKANAVYEEKIQVYRAALSPTARAIVEAKQSAVDIEPSTEETDQPPCEMGFSEVPAGLLTPIPDLLPGALVVVNDKSGKRARP
jgi:hypothetical protein